MRALVISGASFLGLAACYGSEPQQEAISETSADAGPETSFAPSGPIISEGAETSSPSSLERHAAAAGEVQASIPVRFHGTYGETPEACAMRSHGRFTVGAERIQFFESSATVETVRVDGDYAAATVTEEYVEPTRYVFYMALEGQDRLRYRYGKNERMTWTRCP